MQGPLYHTDHEVLGMASTRAACSGTHTVPIAFSLDALKSLSTKRVQRQVHL